MFNVHTCEDYMTVLMLITVLSFSAAINPFLSISTLSLKSTSKRS